MQTILPLAQVLAFGCVQEGLGPLQEGTSDPTPKASPNTLYHGWICIKVQVTRQGWSNQTLVPGRDDISQRDVISSENRIWCG